VKDHTSIFQQISVHSAWDSWPWLIPPLTVMQHVMYFWFCGLRHVEQMGQNQTTLFFVQFARWRHQRRSLLFLTAFCCFGESKSASTNCQASTKPTIHHITKYSICQQADLLGNQHVFTAKYLWMYAFHSYYIIYITFFTKSGRLPEPSLGAYSAPRPALSIRMHCIFTCFNSWQKY